MARKLTEEERKLKRETAEAYRQRRLNNPSSNPKSKQHQDGEARGKDHGNRATVKSRRWSGRPRRPYPLSTLPDQRLSGER